MRHIARLAIIAATALSVVGAPLSGEAFGAPLSEKRLQKLERLLLEQQVRLQRQQERLREQQKKIAEQERRLKAVEKKRNAKRKKVGRNPASKQKKGVLLTPNGFSAVDPMDLSLFRGGVQVPVVRVILPDGTSLFAPADRFRYTLVQDVKPKEPTFITEPEKKKEEKKAAPRKRTPRRTVRRRPRAPSVAPRRPAVPVSQPKREPAPEDKSIRAKSEKQVDQLLLDKGAILLKPGTLQIEPGFEYATFSSSNVAINGVSLFNAIIIGTIRVDDVKRQVVQGSVKARYGITSRLQVDTTVPVIWRTESEVLGVGTPDVSERNISGFGLGDIEFGLTGQPLIGRGWIPNVLVRVGARVPTGEDVFSIPTVTIGPGGQTRLTRAPTGTGFWAINTTVTAVWSIDPVAFFVGGGYTWNLSRNVTGVGTINPGNSFSYFAGMNIAINERVALNLSFNGQNYFSTSQNGQTVPNTSFIDGRVILGASIGLTDNISLLANAGIGLTRQSPDFTFTVSVPISLSTR